MLSSLFEAPDAIEPLGILGWIFAPVAFLVGLAIVAVCFRLMESLSGPGTWFGVITGGMMSLMAATAIMRAVPPGVSWVWVVTLVALAVASVVMATLAGVMGASAATMGVILVAVIVLPASLFLDKANEKLASIPMSWGAGALLLAGAAILFRERQRA